MDGPEGVGSAASLNPPTDRDGRLHPRNPWVGFFLALVLLVTGVAGLAAVALDPDILFASTNRRAGLILIAPAIALLSGVFSTVRGFRALARWLAHRAATPLTLRRRERAADLDGQRLWPLLALGIPAFLGFVTLAVIFARYAPGDVDPLGRLIQLEVLGFLFLFTVGPLGLAAQKLHFAQFYAGRDPRHDLPPV